MRIAFIALESNSIYEKLFTELLPASFVLMLVTPGSGSESQLSKADVVVDVGGWGTRDMMDAALNAKLWQILGTGFDHFDLSYASNRFVVANTPGHTGAVALAECAVMHMLMLARDPFASRESLMKGRMWEPIGSELQNKRLLILGFGASGAELAMRASAFGMRIRAIDIMPIESNSSAGSVLSFAGGPDDLDTELSQADYVSIHVPLSSTTHHLIDSRRLALMPRGARIINVARGAVVDEDALLRAIDREKLAGAGIDVYSEEPPDPNSPLLNHPRINCTGHIAGMTFETAERRTAAAIENVQRLAHGVAIHHVIGGEQP